MTRPLMLAAVLCSLACSRNEASTPRPPPPAAVAQRPDMPRTDTAEGHGGIAIADTKNDTPPAPSVTATPEPTGPATGEVPSARELYMRAYALKESAPDEAAKLFQRVVDIAPAGDELRGRASRQLKQR